jgi:hypothetical protein
MENFDRGLHLFFAAHADEGESTGAACVAIHHDVGIGDLTMLSEEFTQFNFGGIKGQVAHVHFCIAHLMSSWDSCSFTSKKWSR